MASASLPTAHSERPFWPRRNWWLALLVILVLAGALRYPGYDFSLPYVERERTDESYYLLTARLAIDYGSAKPLNMQHYPPGIIAVNYIVLRLFQDPSTPPSTVLPGLRLLAISVSLTTVVALALLGYHAANPLAGLIAAILWALTPELVNISRFATSDIYVTFLTVMTLWMTIVGVLNERPGWLIGTTYALMLAIIFKYSALALVPLVLLAPLLNGRRALRIVASNIGRFAIFIAWLLLLTPFLEAFQIYDGTGPDTSWAGILRKDTSPNLTGFINILRSFFTELNLLPLLPGWLGMAWLAGRASRTKERFAAIFLLVVVLAWFVEMSLVQSNHLLYTFPPMSLLILLAGVGYALIWQATAPRLARVLRRPVWLPAAGALALFCLLNLPNLQASVANLRDKMRSDQRNDLVIWADGTLLASKYIANDNNRRTLNREWGGYAGETRFHYTGNVLSDTPLEEWRAQGVLFAIVPHFQYQLWREEGTNEFVTETTLLKSYPPSDAHRGPAMVVLLLQPIPHAATGQLGPIRLIGYELAEESARPGDSLPFHLYWQAAAATVTDYQVFNHLLDEEGNLVAQADGPPLPDPLLRRGTSNWDDPEEIIHSREYVLTLPEDLAPGEYTLVSGFYRRDTGQRLLSPTGEDALWVTRIEVG